MSPRWLLAVLLILSSPAFSQEPAIPFIIGRPITMIAPAMDAAGRNVVFGSAITPDGTPFGTVDIYVVGADSAGLRRLTKLPGLGRAPQGATALSLTPDGLWASFAAFGLGLKGEEVHRLDVARGVDKTLVVDTQGCIQPLAAAEPQPQGSRARGEGSELRGPEQTCPNCFFACVQTPHIAADGATVLYAVRRQKPFYLVKDGAPPQNLAVYSGTLAPSPQRVMTRSGQVVFSSSAPFGPTFAAAPGDIYLMNLDGSGIRQVTKFGDPSVYARDATISADGSLIAFVANLNPATGKATNTSQIFTVRADGSALRQITSGEAPTSSPSLNADGTRLAYVADGNVFMLAGDKGPLRQLTRFQLSAAGAAVISEDSSRIAFMLGPPNGGAGAIYVVSSDGSGLRAVYAPRSLNPDGVTGAAQGLYAPVAGSLASAYGTNFTADTIAYAASLPLPEILAGVSLTVNGAPMPLLAVSPWQINAQIPPELNEGPAAFEVRFSDGARSAPVAETVRGFGPAIYLLPGIRYNQAAALHAGTGIPVDPAHPAQAGQAVELYASGLGPTDPFVPAGAAAPAKPPAVTLARPEVTIGVKPARVLFSGLAPGFVGVYQVNVIVPEGLRPGDQFVMIKVANLQGDGGVITTK